MGKIKGTGVNAIRAYIVETYGDEAFTKVANAVSPETAGAFTRSLGITWVPGEYVREFYRAAVRMLGDGSTSLCRNVGAYNAAHDLPKFFKSLLGLTGPGLVFEMLGMVWKLYYDTGTVHVLDKGRDFLIVEVKGFEDAGEEICEDIAGYCEALLNMLKLQNPKVVHTRCAGRGDKSCIFEGRWTA